MPKYIDQEVLLVKMHSSHTLPFFKGHMTDEDVMFTTMVSIVKEQPTADVEEVVRCEKCTQWRRNIGFVDSPNGHCFYHCIDTNCQDFCSYGERKVENGRC